LPTNEISKQFDVSLVDGDGLGRTWIDANGYVRHRPNNYVHRTVMEKRLGRKLRTQEHVHHKDHNKQNNSLDNLEVCSPKEHLMHHAHERITNLGGVVGQHLWCGYHKCLHLITEFSTSPRSRSGRHHSCRQATNEYRRLHGLTLWANKPNKWRDLLNQQYRRVRSNYTKREISWL
jgi:hypothetical protein